MPGMNPKTGRWARDGEEIAIAVGRALTTPKETRVMRRFLGVARGALLDRPAAPDMLGPAARACAESLLFEPRVKFIRLGLDSADASGKVGLTAQFRVIAGGLIGRMAL